MRPLYGWILCVWIFIGLSGKFILKWHISNIFSNLIIINFTWHLNISAKYYFRLSKSGLRQKEDELKQFLFYSLYGWGCPLILISIIIFFHFIDVLPSALRISVGVQGCTIDKSIFSWNLLMKYLMFELF